MKAILKKPVVAIDLDGVIANYDGIWRGERHIGKPFPGAKKFLMLLKKADIDFIILTARNEKKHVLHWCAKNNLPKPLKITNIKPQASVYIDDRAINFDGNFARLTRKLANFSVYWRKNKRFSILKKYL